MKHYSAIIDGMAKAFFMKAYADQADESGNSLSGADYADVIPLEIDPYALDAAISLSNAIEKANNGKTLDELYESFPGGLTAEDWGHYAAMQAMSPGVSLRDHGITKQMVKVPRIEFTKYDLSKEYFPVDRFTYNVLSMPSDYVKLASSPPIPLTMELTEIEADNYIGSGWILEKQSKESES